MSLPSVQTTVELKKLTADSPYTSAPREDPVDPAKLKERPADHTYIGKRLFYAQYTAEVRADLLAAERLKTLIRTLAIREREKLLIASPAKVPTIEQLEKKLWKNAGAIVDNLITNTSSQRWLSAFAFFINNLLARMYHQGIHLLESQVVELRKWALFAEKQKISLLFLPSHKSHIDYLVASFVFYKLGLSLPAIAAGNNLDMPIVGPILKKMGAWFIRRGNWSADPLYVGIVRDYVEYLLNTGQNIEFFIEGTRSRIGKLLNPRFGILKIILEAMLAGNIKDCVVVPISIGYDKVIETGSYVKELLGAEKEAESLQKVVGASSVLSLKLGRIDIRFAQPYLLSSFIEEEKTSGRRPNWNPKENAEHRTVLLQAFGFRILSEINDCAVIMPTALVGTVLLTLRGAQGVGRDELIQRFIWLRAAILARGGNVADFGGMSIAQVVDRAIEVMKDLIGTRSGLLEPVYYVIKPFELSFYRNQVINIFISDAIVSMSLYATVKGIGTQYNPRSILYEDLLQEIGFVSQLLKTEFIYKPGRLEMITRDTIDALVKADILATDKETGDEFVTLSPAEAQNGRENFDFFCFLLWPFLECYWLSCVSCFMLAPDGGKAQEIEEKTFMERIQLFGQTLFYEGDLLYLEAINKETLKNAVARMKEFGILVTRDRPADPSSKTAGSVKVITLHPDWIPQFPLPGGKATFTRPSGRIWEMCERIGRYRREGKQRRDNASTSHRILKMARLTSEYYNTGKKGILGRQMEAGGDIAATAEEVEHEKKLQEEEKIETEEIAGVDAEGALEKKGELRERGPKL